MNNGVSLYSQCFFILGFIAPDDWFYVDDVQVYDKSVESIFDDFILEI